MSPNHDPSQSQNNGERAEKEALLRAALDTLRISASNLLVGSEEEKVSIGDNMYNRTKTTLDADEHGSSVLARLRPENPGETEVTSLRLIDTDGEDQAEAAYTLSYDADKKMALKDESGAAITDLDKITSLHEYLVGVAERRQNEEVDTELEEMASPKQTTEAVRPWQIPAAAEASAPTSDDALGESLHNFRQKYTSMK